MLGCLCLNKIMWRHTGSKCGLTKSRSLRDTSSTNWPKFFSIHSVVLLEVNAHPLSETHPPWVTSTSLASSVLSEWQTSWLHLLCFFWGKVRWRRPPSFFSASHSSDETEDWTGARWEMVENKDEWSSWHSSECWEMVFLQLLEGLTAEVFAADAAQ